MKLKVKPVATVMGALLLPGCGITSAVTTLGYAIDGMSYAASGKGVADHALSAATYRDCAVFRAVTGGELCRDFPDTTAEVGPVLAMIDTAAGGAGGQPAWLIAGAAPIEDGTEESAASGNLADPLLAAEPDPSGEGDIAALGVKDVPGGPNL